MRLYARCQWMRTALDGAECGKEAEFYHPPTHLKYCAEHALAFRNTLLLAALKPLDSTIKESLSVRSVE